MVAIKTYLQEDRNPKNISDIVLKGEKYGDYCQTKKYMSENIFDQYRRRLARFAVSFARRSFGRHYPLSSLNVSARICHIKLVNFLILKKLSNLKILRLCTLVFLSRRMGQFLEKPKVEKHNDRGKNDDIRYGLGSMQGWRYDSSFSLHRRVVFRSHINIEWKWKMHMQLY